MDRRQHLAHRYLYGQAVDQVLAVETFDEYGDPDDILWGLEDHQGTIRDIVGRNLNGTAELKRGNLNGGT